MTGTAITSLLAGLLPRTRHTRLQGALLYDTGTGSGPHQTSTSSMKRSLLLDRNSPDLCTPDLRGDSTTKIVPRSTPCGMRISDVERGWALRGRGRGWSEGKHSVTLLPVSRSQTPRNYRTVDIIPVWTFQHKIRCTVIERSSCPPCKTGRPRANPWQIPRSLAFFRAIPEFLWIMSPRWDIVISLVDSSLAFRSHIVAKAAHQLGLGSTPARSIVIPSLFGLYRNVNDGSFIILTGYACVTLVDFDTLFLKDRNCWHMLDLSELGCTSMLLTPIILN
ncbi:hypothetical protein B0H11DRAFT_1943755 [Mycena galericulata]|nr:hypothetical protein B0H11DRAFT_1943755 [Mycena galericulata]